MHDDDGQTRVLQSAEYIYENAIDVVLDMRGTKHAASTIWNLMQEKEYSCKKWAEHGLHPKAKDASTVDIIFMMDLLNFCFWSDNEDPESRFAVEFQGQQWSGYWSLVACLQRALEEGIPITSPPYWVNEDECTDEKLRHVFRSATSEEMPMLEERISCIREAGRILVNEFHGTFLTCIEEAKGSAASLVNLLVDNFPCFRDETAFEDETVRFYKRAQILVADLWACFEGTSYGRFHDIDSITMFADYRIPQMLYALGCLQYSPPLENYIQQQKPIESGHLWEIQLRGCSIWAVELIRREILRQHPKARINAILIDFFLYDTIKEREATKSNETIPHHRTRSIWY